MSDQKGNLGFKMTTARRSLAGGDEIAMIKPIRLAALISGAGRTLMNLADRIDDGSLPASVELVIASRRSAPGVERCRARGLDVRLVLRRDFSSEQQMHDAITAALLEKEIDLVCLCGYLRRLRVDEPFEGRVMNIHPALLPDYALPRAAWRRSCHRRSRASHACPSAGAWDAE